MTALTRVVTAEVTTTDATTTTLYEDTSGSGKNGAYLFLVLAEQTGSSRSQYRSWVIHAMRYSTFEASHLFQQAKISEIGDGASTAWTATCDLNGANLRVRVTGAAATNITWKVSVTRLAA